MRLLALDTATRVCSVAALVDGRIVHEIVDESGDTHSRHLMALVERAVSRSVGRIDAFDGFAVTRGPGSFTGLRIGISTAKGLSAATGRPLLGISTLRVLAAQAPPTGRTILALLDARRNEVYRAAFRYREGGIHRLTPDAAAAPESAADGIEGPSLLLGDGALRYRDRLLLAFRGDAVLAEPDRHGLRASTLARLAATRFPDRAGSAAVLLPTYVRPSYAGSARWKG
jgi:tRNA threonylcarbamoyladenosine biosynthesis protein TsaB